MKFRCRNTAILIRRAAALAVIPFLFACGGQPPRQTETKPPTAGKPASTPRSGGGGFYQDDGPIDTTPAQLAAVLDAQPRAEPLHRFANRPYNVLGRDYAPMREIQPYKARGVGSWYGRKFHGQKTSSGEIYDMLAMTAAHPTLPIPSYARVTNLANGKSVVVRINDRGPFLHERLIDLSYVAAWKLGYVDSGSAKVEVETVLPGAALPASPPPPPSPSPPAPDADAGEAPPPLPAEQEQRGLFLQLGAFSSLDNAESFRAHLSMRLNWLNETIGIYPRDGMYRLHLGPYRDAQEANRVADRIRETLDFKPFVVQR
ncbi:MAG: septal ring lytic transglycosylase RlpA family protein [Zoogloeaceae bacterium]|jgi:rare lipoprotein A|nr:septal ring lytic transglycosylase RlpA family protein [Zoogloeaceae bacterium]